MLPARYHNNRDGTFTRVADAAMPKYPSNEHGSAWGDYDNDGYIDLFIAGHDDHNRLFHNNGDGSFAKITDHPFVNDLADSEGRAFVDYDDDGDLDLFVSSAFGDYTSGGAFTRVTDSGLSDVVERTSASCFANYDNDGFPDLFLANHGKPNSLYHNNGNGTFTRITTSGIMAAPFNGLLGGSLNCGWADYDNDGRIDLYLGWGEPYSFVISGSVLYHNEAAGLPGATTTTTASSTCCFPTARSIRRRGSPSSITTTETRTPG